MFFQFCDFAHAIDRMGGTAYVVGGAVRDMIMGREPHDHDLMIAGLETDAFKRRFPEAVMTGSLFPVYRLSIAGEEVEVAFARTEEKVESGHSGFRMTFSSDVTVEDDLLRRDVTINALAVEILTGEVVDLFDGVEDIQRGVIRAVSSHFVEDPVRVLRVARQAAQFGFEVDADTIDLMRSMADELAREPVERVVGEMNKALATTHPSTFFRVLRECDCLSVAFPAVAALIGQTQPVEHHPEGDAFEHTMLVLDAVAAATADVRVRFAALMHDIGKGATPAELLPKHHGHDKAGVDIVAALPSAYGRKTKELASFVSEHHMRAHTIRRPAAIRDFLFSMRRRGIAPAMIAPILRADQGSVPSFVDESVMDVIFARIEIPSDMDVRRIPVFVRETQIARLRDLLE